MATFFDATNTAHLSLITRSVRAHQDLAPVAQVAESDVIEQYTLRERPVENWTSQFYLGRGYAKGIGVYVCLEGFNPDADAVTDPELVTALRYTIADVITWRLIQYGESPLLSGVSTTAGGGKTFREDAFLRFPQGTWSWRLMRWDLRPPTYVLG